MSIPENASQDVSSLSLENFTSVSEFDLDEMYRRNVQMLDYIENLEASSNISDQSSKLYHSSINVYISSKDSLKQSDEMYNNFNSDPMSNLKKRNLEIINKVISRKMSNHLNRSSLYSSYETLYDNLKSRSKVKPIIDETMPQSVKENTNDHFTCYNKSNKAQSSDSDKTLKSLSSEDSFSTISSVDSANEESRNQFDNQLEKTLYNSHYFENIKDNPMLRPLTKNLQVRPTSCYVDTKYGQYLSNKYPSRPNIVIIKRQDSNDRSNIVISKPLGNYSSRLLNNCTPMTDSNNAISKSIVNKSSLYLNNENKSNYRRYLSVNNGSSSSNNFFSHQISLNDQDRNLNLTRSIYNTSFPKLNNTMQIEHNNNKEADQIIPSKICTIKQSKSQIFSNNNSTNSEKSNQNFIDLSFQSANNARPHYAPSNDIQSVSISKSYQIQRNKKS